VKLDNPKLLTLDEAMAERTKLRAAGKKLVLTNGVFDLLHTGHLYYLKEARRLGEALYVAINSDESVRALKGPTRPVMTEEQRAYALGALWFVSGIIIFREKRLVPEIRVLRPDIYCKAGDYTFEKLNPEERTELEKVGAAIKFLPFLPGFSTTNLIAKIRAAGEI
jgi:rfaE bifunctional protein nucleotidyltransferase chain/domain